jgi:hypothetical protein
MMTLLAPTLSAMQQYVLSTNTCSTIFAQLALLEKGMMLMMMHLDPTRSVIQSFAPPTNGFSRMFARIVLQVRTTWAWKKQLVQTRTAT